VCLTDRQRGGATLVEQFGVEIVRGDLKDRASIAAAVKGVHTVVSTATAIMSKVRGTSLKAVAQRARKSANGALLETDTPSGPLSTDRDSEIAMILHD
jgi:uncharacterized protein YbjT (DUF2867 family)